MAIVPYLKDFTKNLQAEFDIIDLPDIRQGQKSMVKCGTHLMELLAKHELAPDTKAVNNLILYIDSGKPTARTTTLFPDGIIFPPNDEFRGEILKVASTPKSGMFLEYRGLFQSVSSKVSFEGGSWPLCFL